MNRLYSICGQKATSIDGVSQDSAVRKVSGVSQRMRRSGCAFLSANSEGNAMVEMALMLPILLGVVMAIYSFGSAFFNWQTLQTAVAQGAQELQFGGDSVTNPCLQVRERIVAVAPTLDASQISYHLVLNNTEAYPAISASAEEHSWTGTAGSCPASLTSLTSVTVSATYPCNLHLYGVSVAAACNLPATTTYQVQ